MGNSGGLFMSQQQINNIKRYTEDYLKNNELQQPLRMQIILKSNFLVFLTWKQKNSFFHYRRGLVPFYIYVGGRL